MDEATKAVLLADPALFIATYFSHRIKKLEDFHLRLIRAATEETRALVLYPATHGKCLDAGTLVLMDDGTLREARDVAAGDMTALGLCEASQSNGEAPTLRIKLRTGHEITTTINHPFKLESGEWREADDLMIGDEVVMVNGFEAPGVGLPDEAFRLIGYFIGDGSVTNNCRLTTADPEIAEDFERCLNLLGFRVGSIQMKHKRAKEYPAIGGCKDWLIEQGVYGYGSHDKHVPDVVYRASNEQVQHFLAAYFACDGSWQKGTSGFEFYSVSERLLRGVQHLLLRLGIVASLSVKWGRYKGEPHKSWRLRIPSEGFDEIRTWPIILERKRPPRTEERRRYLPTVASIEDAGKRETWSLQIAGGEHYTADILTHNTTLVSTLLPIHAFCKDPDIRIAIIGKNDTEVDGIMQVIQAECTANDQLIRDFGPFKPPKDDASKPWALGRMSVAQRKIRAKESTITVFGAGARTVLGYRTDWTICDDVVTSENSATSGQREKLRNWFDLCVETGPEHADSRMTVVGTRFDPNDLYGDLEDLEDEGTNLWFTMREDAIVELCSCKHPLKAHTRRGSCCARCKCRGPIPSGEWEPLWPQRWPRKRLMQQKVKVGTLNFNKRYRNIAVDASRMVFKEEYVKGGTVNGVQFPGCIDRRFVVGDLEPTWRAVAGFDPAVGTTKSAKFCAHLILAQGTCIDHERCYWVIDLERLQLTLPQMIDMVVGKHAEYKLMMSVVETNSFQAGLMQAIEDRMRVTGHAYQIGPHFTNKENKPDPEMGVQSMSPWFERGAVHIPWGDPTSQRKMAQLVEELIMYPGKTTDTVMAFWFAWRQLERSAPKYASFNRLAKEAPTWNRTMSRRVLVNPAYRGQH